MWLSSLYKTVNLAYKTSRQLNEVSRKYVSFCSLSKCTNLSFFYIGNKTTCDIQWHPVTSSDTQWHTMTPSDIQWHPVTYNDTQWHTMTPSDIKWHFVTSCDILCRLVTSCVVLWHLVSSCVVLWHLVTSCDIKWHLVTSSDILQGLTTNKFNVLFVARPKRKSKIVKTVQFTTEVKKSLMQKRISI
jgi:hypothetical protein